MKKVPTGQHGIQTYRDGHTDISMDQWMMPTLHNLGSATVYIQGIPIEPGYTYQFGPEGATCTQTIHISYGATGTKKVAVAYFKLNANCN